MKISIVIVSYNQGKFLEATILSALNQTYTNKEIILIDGGSEDSSIKIINKYRKEFTYWISEKDNGQSDAIIKGFNKCSGDILTWINSDDILCLSAAEEVVKLAQSRKLSKAVYYGDSYVIDEKGKIREKFKYGKFDYSLAKVLGPTISQPGTFFSRKGYFEVGGIDVSLQYGMDLDLFCNFLFSDIPFLYTGVYMAKFRKYSTQKGHKVNYLEICNQETKIINSKYGFDNNSGLTKKKARMKQIFIRIINGYYLVAFGFRIVHRRTIKEFNPKYTQ